MGALLLIWINLAVGIIGDEGDTANLLYLGVLAVGLGGALLARFEAGGMARAMLLTAVAVAIVGVVALAAGWGATGPRWPLDVAGLTVFFAAVFGGAAWLFRQAARERWRPARPRGTRRNGAIVWCARLRRLWGTWACHFQAAPSARGRAPSARRRAD